MRQKDQNSIQNLKQECEVQKKKRSKQKRKVKVYIPKIKKKRFWTEDQDRILEIGVQKYGSKKWSEISKLLKNRHPKRCRQRWFNYLVSKNSTWNTYDLWILFLAYKIHGNRWSQISKILNRGDNIVKNKVICLKRKGIKQFEEKLKKIDFNKIQRQNFTPIELTLLQTLLGTHLVTQVQQERQKQTSQVKDSKQNQILQQITRQKYKEAFCYVYGNPAPPYQISYQPSYPGCMFFYVPMHFQGL